MQPNRIYLPNGIDSDHLETVKADMARLGAPTIRVVDCGDYYQAIEGTHRLQAAYEMGFVVNLTVLDQGDMVEADSLDLEDLQPGETYTAGEVAGELTGRAAPVAEMGDDGIIAAIE